MSSRAQIKRGFESQRGRWRRCGVGSPGRPTGGGQGDTRTDRGDSLSENTKAQVLALSREASIGTEAKVATGQRKMRFQNDVDPSWSAGRLRLKVTPPPVSGAREGDDRGPNGGCESPAPATVHRRQPGGERPRRSILGTISPGLRDPPLHELCGSSCT